MALEQQILQMGDTSLTGLNFALGLTPGTGELRSYAAYLANRYRPAMAPPEPATTNKPFLMSTLYEVLGVRPDDDAETLTRAFRKAALASHPDLHRGDAEAPARFTEITEAYHVLRDAGQRAAYDEDLALERDIRRAAARRSAMIFGARAALVAVIGVAVGYAWWLGIPQTIFSAVTESRAAAHAAEPVRPAAVEVAVSGPQMPIVITLPPDGGPQAAPGGEGTARHEGGHPQAPDSGVAPAAPAGHAPVHADATTGEGLAGQLPDAGY